MHVDESLMKELWSEFARTGIIDPRVRPIIAESWLRCRERGLSVYEKNPGRIASEIEMISILERNHDLLETAVPLMESLWRVLNNASVVISLSDKDCNLLKIIGDKEKIKRFAKSYFKRGACWSESLIGTNALALCIDLDMPVQTAGPEQYCLVHHKATGSGAPIHDENGEIIGSLNITSDMEIFSHFSLGVVSAMAKSIEQQIRLMNVNGFMTSGLDSLTDGIILTDGAFRIKQVNKKCCEIFGEMEEDLIGTDLRDILRDDVEKIIRENYFRELNFQVKGKRMVCFGRVNKSMFNGRIMGCSVLFRTKKTMNKAVNVYVGNKASYQFDNIVTGDDGMKALIRQAQTLSKEDCDLLLYGESGTGKEIFAQSIHNASQRCTGPFVAVNCAALPKELVESELFGYESGAFTGAKKEGLVGKFELANGGTLMLDEIGEMPLESQAKLLRVLESKKIVRIGGKSERTINARIVAVTNKNLAEEVSQGTFRLDLFYRINVVSLEVPRLNQRGEDPTLLVNFFLDRLNGKTGKKKVFDKESLEIMSRYSWPGNVRQLQNVVARAYYLCGEDVITRIYLPEEIIGVSAGEIKMKIGDTIDSVEKSVIEKTIKRCGGNITRSARELNISKPTLYRKMRKYEINKDELIL